MSDARPPEQLLPPPKNFRTSAAHRALAAGGVVPAFIARASRLERRERLLLRGLAQLRVEQLDGVLRASKRLCLAGGGRDAAAARFARPEPFRALVDELRALPVWEASWVDARPLSATRLAKLQRVLLQRVQRFNARWEAELARTDLDPINALVEGYNTWYPIEREMFRVYGSREPFVPRTPWDLSRLRAAYPLLDLGPQATP